MAEITHYELTGEDIEGDRPKQQTLEMAPAFGDED